MSIAFRDCDGEGVLTNGRAGQATSIDAPAYVLAGREHGWPLAAGTVAGPIQLEAETSIGPLHATVGPASG